MRVDNTMNNTDTKPWFRQFWPWVIFGLPAATIVACMGLIYAAVTTADGMVSDDYYKEGLAINQTLAKDQKALELGLSAYARVGDSGLELFITSPTPVSGDLSLKLLHPTRADQDLALPLEKLADNHYRSTVSNISGGKWHVELIDDSGEWRIRGRMDYPTTRDVRLIP